jgi:hypothetical protein
MRSEEAKRKKRWFSERLGLGDRLASDDQSSR